jgi:hypothetical protein
MNYVVIALAYGDGDDPGLNVYSVRFFTQQAAIEATDWLNSIASISEAKLFVDASEER